MMGILGHGALGYVCELMFESIDSACQGFIQLREYLAFTDILVHGSTH